MFFVSFKLTSSLIFSCPHKKKNRNNNELQNLPDKQKMSTRITIFFMLTADVASVLYCFFIYLFWYHIYSRRKTLEERFLAAVLCVGVNNKRRTGKERERERERERDGQKKK